MPLYEYECQACHERIEAQQRMADAALTKCPKCGKDELQKLISATAFHLKGGGWYKDLYSSQKPAEKSGDKSGDSKASAATTPAASSESSTSKESATTTTESKPVATKPSSSGWSGSDGSST